MILKVAQNWAEYKKDACAWENRAARSTAWHRLV